ncbi:MAG: four helix bundle protein [Kiritimatiellae bacterium]|nr:four helix bundle protein [Kiritimatiellia bacterium]
MAENSIVYEKSKCFALRIVNLYRYLVEEKRELVMSKQLLRCGTSIGANMAEAICAVSRADFTNKAYIALKESSETRYWLDLLRDAKYLTNEEYVSIRADADELFKMLTAITKTLKSKNLNVAQEGKS